MGGADASMMGDGGGGASDLGSAGQFDASKSIVAGPDEYGSGYGMSNAQRVPDFYDDAGQPVYMGEAAGGGKKEMLKKILGAIGNSGSAMGGSGGGGGGGVGGGGQSAPGQGPTGANQFFVSQPWNIPNVGASNPGQVQKAQMDAIMSIIKGASKGMG